MNVDCWVGFFPSIYTFVGCTLSNIRSYNCSNGHIHETCFIHRFFFTGWRKFHSQSDLEKVYVLWNIQLRKTCVGAILITYVNLKQTPPTLTWYFITYSSVDVLAPTDRHVTIHEHMKLYTRFTVCCLLYSVLCMHTNWVWTMLPYNWF